MNHTNKIALVTGGSRGLGRNTVLKLARDGADVILTYHQNRAEADLAVKEIELLGHRAAALQLDVGKIATFDSFCQQLATVLQHHWQRQNIDFLINNAGIGLNKPFADTNEADFDNLLNVHFKGVYFFTQKLLPWLADGGAIVCTSSGLARFAIPGFSAYAAMKGAVETLMLYLAKELGHRRIRVNTIAPGAIKTELTKIDFDANPQMHDFIVAQTALGRIGVPDDIGGVISFLCSEEGRWVNAQRIEASGGMLL